MVAANASGTPCVPAIPSVAMPDPAFTKLNQAGGSTPPTANGGWASEIALDVEWAHAMAPKAGILLVEANSSSYSDLFTAVRFAAGQSGVVAGHIRTGNYEKERRAC